jgi:hypothetical protein
MAAATSISISISGRFGWIPSSRTPALGFFEVESVFLKESFLGLEEIDAGPFYMARYLEQFALLWVNLAPVQGLGSNIASLAGGSEILW